MPERNGLVERIVHATVPPRVDSTFTEEGQGLRATVDSMCGWARRYIGHIEASRRRFDA